jgi:hypothetical protein
MAASGSPVKAYCPSCDKVHGLAKTHRNNYVCSRRPRVSFVYMAHGRYFGVRDPHTSPERCGCTYPERIYFANATVPCYKCGLPSIPAEYEWLMANFTKMMFSVIRDVSDENASVSADLRVTFPDRFQEIANESDDANAAALAPHLPPVLAEIVAEYFGWWLWAPS